MSPVEVCHRLGARCRNWIEGGFLEGLPPLDHLEVNVNVPRLPAKSVFPESTRSQLATDARRLLRGDWQIFGWRDVNVGAPPCWHRDPASGVVIDPDRPARSLNHRELPDGGDARSIWEINRWAEMTRLAMHGWLNDDLETIRTAQLWIEDWCDRNPPGLGINWTSPLEVALRLLNFTWFDALVQAAEHGKNQRVIRDAQSSLAKRVVPVHAAWIWRYKSAGSSANNHLLGELAALVVAGSRWPALEKAVCTVELVWEALSAEVVRQFSPDGGTNEQALHYHLFAFELAWHAVRAVGCKAGDAYDRLSAAAHFFKWQCSPSGDWDFGDNDDAQVLPLPLNRSQASREWRAWFAGEAGDLKHWLGAPPPVPPLKRDQSTPWRAFARSGMATLDLQNWFVRLDASPLGFGSLAAHGHSDALHVSIWDAQQAIFIDPGTGGYYGHPEWRSELSHWSAHNGPRPSESGFETPRRIGPFLQIQHHAQPGLVIEGPASVARFSHEGHQFQRLVRWSHEGIEIHDTEDSSKAFDLNWCLAPECELRPLGQDRWQISRGSQKWELLTQAPGAQIRIREGHCSPGYGRMEPTVYLSVEQVKAGLITRLTRQITTV
ncbi:MAG: hypothetical protein RL015_122 [Verrucomicrobiota bacterium]